MRCLLHHDVATIAAATAVAFSTVRQGATMKQFTHLQDMHAPVTPINCYSKHDLHNTLMLP
jgi:hypothetical protein